MLSPRKFVRIAKWARKPPSLKVCRHRKVRWLARGLDSQPKGSWKDKNNRVHSTVVKLCPVAPAALDAIEQSRPPHDRKSGSMALPKP